MSDNANTIHIHTGREISYNGVDLVKFLCAFLVCAIHIPPFSDQLIPYSGYVNLLIQQYIARLAVPFYFTAAGFFLFRKMSFDSLDVQRIKRYCRKVLLLSGIWHMLLIHGETYHLWFLGGLAVGVITLALCLQHFRVKQVIAIAAALYIMGLLFDAYAGIGTSIRMTPPFRAANALVTLVFGVGRNGVFFGMPYLLLGALFSKWKVRINTSVAITGLALSLAMMLLEMYLLHHYTEVKDYNMFLFLMPATFFLFYLSLHFRLKNRVIYRKLRAYGQLIFFLHLYIRSITGHGLRLVNRFFHLDLKDYTFFLTVVGATFAAILIEWLSHKKHLTWLKYLYT